MFYRLITLTIVAFSSICFAFASSGFNRIAYPSSDTTANNSPTKEGLAFEQKLTETHGGKELILANKAYAKRDLAWKQAQTILSALQAESASGKTLLPFATPTFAKTLQQHEATADKLVETIAKASHSSLGTVTNNDSQKDYMVIRKNYGQQAVDITVNDHAACLDKQCMIQFVLRAPPPYTHWNLVGLNVFNLPVQ